jgi:hypothetical protein
MGGGECGGCGRERGFGWWSSPNQAGEPYLVAYDLPSRKRWTWYKMGTFGSALSANKKPTSQHCSTDDVLIASQIPSTRTHGKIK